jgi:cytoskeletal protein CcmA (bactofilin family)
MAIKQFMARVERGIEGVRETGSCEPVRPAAPVRRTVAPSTSVDASSVLEGRLSCKETLRIDGRIKGDVDCQKMVLVGESARVYASIAADEVRISGVVEGDIVARRKVTLERTAVVTGDLTTRGIVIEEGAKLKGRIVIGAEADAEADGKQAKDGKEAESGEEPQAARVKPGGTFAPQPASATG